MPKIGAFVVMGAMSMCAVIDTSAPSAYGTLYSKHSHQHWNSTDELLQELLDILQTCLGSVDSTLVVGKGNRSYELHVRQWAVHLCSRSNCA